MTHSQMQNFNTPQTDKPKKTDPLTIEETQEAADVFFPRFEIVSKMMPEGSTTEDTLKVMENVAKLGHKLRADKAEKDRLDRFGFLKQEDLDRINDTIEKGAPTEAKVSWLD